MVVPVGTTGVNGLMKASLIRFSLIYVKLGMDGRGQVYGGGPCEFYSLGQGLRLGLVMKTNVKV